MFLAVYKIIGADGKEYGPISGEQVRQWMAEGRVNAASRIQVEGSNQWKLVAEVPEFAGALPAQAAHPAPIVMMAAPAAPPNNALAIWALVTGILSLVCCCGLLAPVSIVLGAIALSQIKQDPSQRGKGLALAGLLIGCFVLLLNVIGWIAVALNPTLLDAIRNALNQQQ